jgi:integrase
MKNPKTEYREALNTLTKVAPLIAKGFPDPDSLPDPHSVVIPPTTEFSRSRPARRREARETAKAAKRIRGMGGIYHPSYRDTKTGERVVLPGLWIYYQDRHKKQVKENAHTENEAEAWKLLKKRHGEVAAGRPVGPDVNRTTFDDMATMIVNDYKANGWRSLKRCEGCVEHLRGYFGTDRAIEITSDRITAYVAGRQKEGASNGTINNELATLSRMFELAIIAGKAATKPHISKLAEHNTRKGFFEREQLEAVLKRLPDEIKPVTVTAYVTGWRVHDEILTRQKHHLDLKGGWLRLEPGETKNGEGRNFPLTPMLREALEAQVQKTRALELAKGAIIPWLFHRNGKPITSFRAAWKKACKEAGIPGKIPHDFRRTAVRNLERAGVPRSSAMAMVGHKTQSIYQRYAIVDQGMLEEAALKLALQHEKDQGQQKAAEK